MTEIPGPPSRPVIGNFGSIDADRPIQSAVELAAEHGEIFRFELPGQSRTLFVSSYRLVDELCDESRFDKRIHLPLREIRAFAGDGLFTAYTDEANWEKAHRILMPAFSPVALRTMFDGMSDIAEQLMLKWERLGPDADIDVTEDFTRLTLDTIALCAFSYRFNSFYSDTMHPFVDAMVDALDEAGDRVNRLPLQNRLMVLHQRRFDESVQVMTEVADRLIQHRRTNPLPDGRSDVLTTMLEAADPVTGERLSDENIRNQLVTFLIAGHETTSGLLSFAVYELLRNPEVLAEARGQVDNVLGSRLPEYEDLTSLDFLDRVLRETLRLWPTAPAFGLYPYEDTTIGGDYELSRRDTIIVLIPALHRDPEIWDDPERFDPSRFDFEKAKERPINAWKPFGNGQRSCIGRGFALQEAQLVLAMFLQRFELELADPTYELDVKETLTLKPDGLKVRLRHRERELARRTESATGPEVAAEPGPGPASGVEPHGTAVQVLYGSNAGTAHGFANQLASQATALGYAAGAASGDEGFGAVEVDGLLLVVTSTYEGRPPENFGGFVDWVTGLDAGALAGLRYAVFGCGNTDWSRTYQRIPTLVDEALAAAGAERVVERGAANARGDFLGAFDGWQEVLWPAVAAAFDLDVAEPAAANAELQVKIVEAAGERHRRADGLDHGTIVVNRELADTSAEGVGSKRHIEFALPSGQSYDCGDYLEVLPLNPWALVDRALNSFDLGYDTCLLIAADADHATQLPVGVPVEAGEVFSAYVELSRPAGRRQVETLAEFARNTADRGRLQELSIAESYEAEVLGKGLSVLDLIDLHPSIELPLATYLAMLGPLSPRRYSISSSPRWSTDHATLTVAHLEGDAWSGLGRYEGVASTFLARARPGTRVPISVRPSNVAFHPPEDLSIPLVMVAAGTGIAPFRGFLQDRALRAQEDGVQPAPALLFFGCHGPDSDYLYRNELERWEQAGIVALRPAFSQAPDLGPDGPIRYVQDRLWDDRVEVGRMVTDGATFYVCGDGERMAPAVHDTCVRMYVEAMGVGVDEAEAWLAEMEFEHNRYVSDVFG